MPEGDGDELLAAIIGYVYVTHSSKILSILLSNFSRVMYLSGVNLNPDKNG